MGNGFPSGAAAPLLFEEMNMGNVYVVTNTEHGWDCVEGVFSTEEKARGWIIDRCYTVGDQED
jgi:hypothetical protein